jgi:hypothetical protein
MRAAMWLLPKVAAMTSSIAMLSKRGKGLPCNVAPGLFFVTPHFTIIRYNAASSLCAGTASAA